MGVGGRGWAVDVFSRSGPAGDLLGRDQADGVQELLVRTAPADLNNTRLGRAAAGSGRRAETMTCAL